MISMAIESLKRIIGRIDQLDGMPWNETALCGLALAMMLLFLFVGKFA